jgi:hypothetical protein
MGEHRFDTPEPPTLQVDIPSGNVDVQTADGTESVIVVEGDQRVVDATTVEQRGGAIVVTLNGVRFGLWRFGRNELRVRATVPHGADLRTNTASADVRISGRIGSLDFGTASGDLVASGEIERDAAVKTVSGDVRMARIGGSLTCQTVSGDVEVQAVGGSVTARSVSGDVRFDSLRQGDARFNSVSGDVVVGIASGSMLDIDTGSVSGRLTSEVPLASVPTPGGDASPTVVLRGRTVSGDVRVVRAS